MLVLLFIALAGIGLVQNITWGEACSDESPVFLTFLAGVSACVAMIGIIMTVYGEKAHTGMVIVGILGTVICNLVPIKTGLYYQTMAKHASDLSAFTKFKMGPVWAWFKFTLVGLGKCAKLLMYCTLIGIPMVKIIENSERTLNAYAKQREIEETKKYLKEQENLYRIMHEVEQDRKKNR